VLPEDVDYAFAWGPAVDGWQCAIGFARGSVSVNLRNQSASTVVAQFVDWFQSDLRDASGTIVALLPAVAARIAQRPAQPSVGRLIPSGQVSSHGYELGSRYGRLPRGHYSLVTRHPHPVTGVMLVSNGIEFDIP
jgi:hypothetical protein